MSFILPDDSRCRDDFADEAALREHYWRVRPGDVVLDAGARWGSWTLPALAAGASQVVAIEAIEPESICAVLALQPVGRQERVMVEHVALGAASAGTRKFPHPMDGHIVTASCTTIDRLFAGEKPRLDWVKLDVEGTEADCLRGGRRTLRRLRPRMIIEDHQRIALLNPPPDYRQKIEAELVELGYSWHHIPYLINGQDAGRDFWLAWPMERHELAFQLAHEDKEATASLAAAKALGAPADAKPHVVRLRKP